MSSRIRQPKIGMRALGVWLVVICAIPLLRLTGDFFAIVVPILGIYAGVMIILDK